MDEALWRDFYAALSDEEHKATLRRMKWWDEYLELSQGQGLSPEEVELSALSLCATRFLAKKSPVGKWKKYPVVGEPGVTQKQILEADARHWEDEIESASRAMDDPLRRYRDNPNDNVSERLVEDTKKAINEMRYELGKAKFALQEQERLEKDADIGAQIERLREEIRPTGRERFAQRKPRKTHSGFKNLPPQKADFSNYFDAARLTEKQRECASLRWEYALSVSEIARRLGKDRKTVQDLLAATKKKMSIAKNREAGRKKASITKPGPE